MIVTLTTDFGLADGYVGILKGVILSIAPDAHLVDVSHDIAPQDVRQAAYVLGRAAPYFPRGTVHLAVVDPGVGSARRPLLVQTPDACFVGPDNGLFTFALEQPGAAAYELNRREFWRPAVSATFHGRDIFAPVAAHLANGRLPADLGAAVADPVRLPELAATRSGPGRLHGHVSHIDRFGNLITSIPGAWVRHGAWACHIGGRRIAGIQQTYAAAPPGTLLALVSSGDTVEIAVRDGSAAALLGVSVGEPVDLQQITG
ncbi:MAG: Adenosyl-chloride synthase [Chloroflexi bacterium ADurb.Bin325]|nr:MAG: Adenosyl-chloride synthase [Chloroflexi bacterium ADurb.Bin325]